MRACAWGTIYKRHKVKIALKSSKSEVLLRAYPLGVLHAWWRGMGGGSSQSQGSAVTSLARISLSSVASNYPEHNWALQFIRMVFFSSYRGETRYSF